MWDILVFKFMKLEMGLRELVWPDQYLTVQKKWKKCALEESVASSRYKASKPPRMATLT
jgi:hypothetical protein